MKNIYLLLLTLLSAIVARAQTSKLPNIVFILIDDLGRNDLGVYGSKFYETPNIDKLAKNGIRFTNAYAACPVCSPTRASVLTGKYPARLQITDWLPGRQDMPSQKLLRAPLKQQLPLEEITLAEALKTRGYATAAIGKWHLGGEGFSPDKQGFDVSIAGNQSGSPASYFYPYESAANKRKTPGLSNGKEGEYLTDRLTTEAEKFIESNKDRPFFLYLPHFAVHIPLQAKEDLVEKYKKKHVYGDQHNAIYAAMIQSVDESVGRITRKLDELGIAENTIVVFTSDNGGLSVKEGPNTPATSNAPLRAGKGYLYEGGIREPLIISWPAKVKAGRVSDAVISSVDYFPTFLQAAAVTESSARPDGESFLPLLLSNTKVTSRSIFWHYPHYSNQGGKPGAAIRKGNYKLIEFYEDGKLELYDLEKDISEKNDLSRSLPEIAASLQAELHQWLKNVNAQMTAPNPNYNPQSVNKEE